MLNIIRSYFRSLSSCRKHELLIRVASAAQVACKICLLINFRIPLDLVIFESSKSNKSFTFAVLPPYICIADFFWHSTFLVAYYFHYQHFLNYYKNSFIHLYQKKSRHIPRIIQLIDTCFHPLTAYLLYSNYLNILRMMTE